MYALVGGFNHYGDWDCGRRGRKRTMGTRPRQDRVLGKFQREHISVSELKNIRCSASAVLDRSSVIRCARPFAPLGLNLTVVSKSSDSSQGEIAERKSSKFSISSAAGLAGAYTAYAAR